jgi:metal-responsive CopG/Arc/MetJ family transcriptional regulator
MRISLDIADRDLRSLADLAGRRRVSRAQVIRAAIGDYLARHPTSVEDAFGLWGPDRGDGLADQRRLRAEW